MALKEQKMFKLKQNLYEIFSMNYVSIHVSKSNDLIRVRTENPVISSSNLDLIKQYSYEIDRILKYGKVYEIEFKIRDCWRS